MITQYANFLTPDEFQKAVDLTRFSGNWKFSQSSNEEDSLTFWYLELTQDPFFSDYLMNKIRLVTGQDFKLDRVYANGQTHGLCGNIHRDRQVCEDGEYRTFLIYTHPEWYLAWGGSTIIYDERTKLETFIPPKPNHAVMFDSKMPHIGLEPTRHCKQLRTSVAFKLSVI